MKKKTKKPTRQTKRDKQTIWIGARVLELTSQVKLIERKLAEMEAMTTETWTVTQPTKGTVTVPPPPLPDPDKLEGVKLWEQIARELGHKCHSGNCETPYRDLGELIGVMATKGAPQISVFQDCVRWYGTKGEVGIESKLINGDIPTAAARSALKFVRGKK